MKKEVTFSFIGSFLIILVAFCFCDFLTVDVLKKKDRSVIHYTDNNDTIKSISTITKTDSSLFLSYTLNKKVLNPYVGISIKNKEQFDFENKEIILEFSSDKSQRFHVFLDIQFNDTLNCTLRHPITVIPTQKIYKLQTSDFIIPPWWYKRHKISQNLLKTLDFKKGQRIIFEFGWHQGKGVYREISINSIQISSNNKLIYFISSILLFLLQLVIFLPPTLKKKKEVVIDYQAQETTEEVTTEISEVTQLIKYIGKHYDNPKLSLKLIKKDLKIHENKISPLIKSHLQISYKDYLNQVRITEAKRLLKNTELNINEIATLVGYNNSPTFNRIFKEKEEISPTDYRK